MSPHEHREHNVERLVDALGAVVWEFDWSTDAFIYVSQAAEQLTGFTRDEWMEPGFWASHIHPDDAEQAIAYCRETTGRGEDHQFDYRFLRADGTYVWVRDIVTVDKESTTRCALKGLLLDISAEKAAEAQAQRIEQRLHDLVDGMGLLAVAIEADGTIAYVNSATCTFHGCTREEMIGRPFAEFVPTDQLPNLAKEHRDSLEGCEVEAQTRLELVNARGERRIMVSSRSTVSAEGEALPTVFIVAEDVTDSIRDADEARRKAAEFDAVFEMLRDVYFRVDREGHVLEYKAPHEIMQYAPVGLTQGGRVSSILAPEVREEAHGKLAEAFSAGRMTVQQYELDMDGVGTYWEVRILPIGEEEAAIICRDVSELHHRQQALADSEERYRTLVEISPYAILVLAQDLRVLYANDAAGRLLETSADALTGEYAPPFRVMSDMESPDDVAAFLDGLAAARPGGAQPIGRSEVETITTTRGRQIEIERTAAGIMFEGQPAILLIARDVTSEREAEREVARSRDLLERLMTLIDSGVLLAERSGMNRIVLANRPAEKMFGYEPGTMIGLPVQALHVDPEAAKRSTAAAMSLGESGSYFAEMLLKRANGSAFEAELSVRMLDGPDGGRLSVVRDVSDRKAAEQMLRESETRMRQVITEAPFGVHLFRFDREGHLVLVAANPAADEILGITHDDLIGWPVEVAIPQLASTGIDEVYRRVARDGGQWECALRFDNHGIRHTFDVHVFQNAPGQVVVFFEDITDRVAASELERRHSRRLSALAAQLADAQDRERRHLAEELHDRVSQALAVAHMQLRSAVAECENGAHLPLEQATELLDDAIRETRAITTELFPPVLYELGLPAALRWVCDEMERQYNFACSIEVSELVLPMTDDTKAVLFRSARELLLNSMKHSKVEEAQVRLYEEGHELVLEVLDQGVGFDAADKLESENGGGFGLFSIRERVVNMGGSFEVVSAPEQGTRAIVRMPAGI